jgi:pSer/pThr/pTyr-binding forkhead associated (FHA) protein
MILCPNCLHKEMVGSLFCSECGSQLIYNEGVPTTGISTSSFPSKETSSVRPAFAQENVVSSPSESLISLNIISSGDILPLSGQKEITLGRFSEGQPIVPDIDLTPYKAYESGVSRMHASLRADDDQVTVIDLGSANGTRINGMKITSNIPYPVRHGDILTLGKFKIQILLRNRSNGG